MTFKEFKTTLNRPPYQVIKGIHVMDAEGNFCNILNYDQGITYDHLERNSKVSFSGNSLLGKLDKCEVIKCDVYGSECMHFYLDYTVQSVKVVTVVEIKAIDEDHTVILKAGK